MGNEMKDSLLSSLRNADVGVRCDTWRLTIQAAVGGASAVGFDRKSEDLLVVSSNGQSVFECTSGERIYRNRASDGYDPMLLEGHRLDEPKASPFAMSGADGGGLLTITSDGWTVDTFHLDWPHTFCILQPPGASIYFLHDKPFAPKKDGTYHLVQSQLGKPIAFGFSWSGKSLVWCDRSDLYVWAR
jgi:hypothetical protein